MCKKQDFLHNLRQIAFAHQCEIISKFRAIFNWKVKNSMHNNCSISVQRNRLETLVRVLLKVSIQFLPTDPLDIMLI